MDMVNFVQQEQLFKILHALLLNGETRESTMEFIAAVVNRNQKRSQLQVSVMKILIYVLDMLLLYMLQQSQGRYQPEFYFS